MFRQLFKSSLVLAAVGAGLLCISTPQATHSQFLNIIAHFNADKDIKADIGKWEIDVRL